MGFLQNLYKSSDLTHRIIDSVLCGSECERREKLSTNRLEETGPEEIGRLPEDTGRNHAKKFYVILTRGTPRLFIKCARKLLPKTLRTRLLSKLWDFDGGKS